MYFYKIFQKILDLFLGFIFSLGEFNFIIVDFMFILVDLILFRYLQIDLFSCVLDLFRGFRLFYGFQIYFIWFKIYCGIIRIVQENLDLLKEILNLFQGIQFYLVDLDLI